MKKIIKKVWNLYKKYDEMINYLIVGGLTTVVSLGTYYFCVYTFLNPNNAFQLQIANIISWISCVTFAYFTNRIFVFKSKRTDKLKEAISFYGSRIATLLLEMGIMFVFVTILHFNDKIIKLVAQVVITILNYVLSKLLIFKKK
ncbi:MAG: GtrA family protein [Mollicutes bacterium]|nr:GtrA family protein [Mollicutes bacterium]